MKYKIPETQIIFDKALNFIINILIFYIIGVLVIGLGRTILSASSLLQGGDAAFARIITDILTFLVIIEIFKSFIEYFKSKRFRLHHMLDPAIVFVIREMIVSMYTSHGLKWQNGIVFAVLILSIGIVRTMAVRYSPGDEEADPV